MLHALKLQIYNCFSMPFLLAYPLRIHYQACHLRAQYNVVQSIGTIFPTDSVQPACEAPSRRSLKIMAAWLTLSVFAAATKMAELTWQYTWLHERKGNMGLPGGNRSEGKGGTQTEMNLDFKRSSRQLTSLYCNKHVKKLCLGLISLNIMRMPLQMILLLLNNGSAQQLHHPISQGNKDPEPLKPLNSQNMRFRWPTQQIVSLGWKEKKKVKNLVWWPKTFTKWHF